MLSLQVPPLITAFFMWCLKAAHCQVRFNKLYEVCVCVHPRSTSTYICIYVCVCALSVGSVVFGKSTMHNVRIR